MDTDDKNLSINFRREAETTNLKEKLRRNRESISVLVQGLEKEEGS